MIGMVVASAVLYGGLVAPAQAQKLEIHEKAESPRYGEKLIGMLGRGVLNLSTGFADVLAQGIHESKVGPPVYGTFKGLAQGVGCGLLRTTSGAVDLVTFWIPGFNGAPVSPSYEDCLADEVKIGY
jgi:putative exosortase-associated protein (TIGR04073 family)